MTAGEKAFFEAAEAIASYRHRRYVLGYVYTKGMLEKVRNVLMPEFDEAYLSLLDERTIAEMDE
jgi:hypothetical protein